MRRAARRGLIGLAGVLALAAVGCGGLTSPTPTPTAEPTPVPTPTATPQPTLTPAPTATPLPTLTPAPTAAPSQPSEPRAILEAASEAVKAAESYHAETDMTLMGLLSLSYVVDYQAPDRLRAVISSSMPDDPSGNLDTQLIRIGDSVYVYDSEETDSEWVAVDFGLLESFEVYDPTFNPMGDKLIARMKDMSVAEVESPDGVSLYQVIGKLSGGELSGTTLGLLFLGSGEVEGELDVVYRVGVDDSLIREITVEGELAVGEVSGDVSMAVRLSDFGKEVVVEAPDPEDVTPGQLSQPPTPGPSTPMPEEREVKQYDAPPAMTIDPDKFYTATFTLEKGGEFMVELYPKEAPNTVNSFVFLARDGFYDGVTFHRVIEGFMAQTGDPTGTGRGGPGYRFANEVSRLRRHDLPGIVSMANSGGEATNGSQFFITFVPTPFLDGFDADGNPKNCSQQGVSCHTVFGRVINGMDVVNGISPRDPATASAPGDVIKTITILEE